MCSNVFIDRAFLILCLLVFPSMGFAQTELDKNTLKVTAEELTSYTRLVEQITGEIELAKGIEARALKKQLRTTQRNYRDLLWKFVDDLAQLDNKTVQDKYAQLVSSHLSAESATIKKAIEKAQKDADVLEETIIAGKKNIYMVGRDAGKARLADLQWKLYKKGKELDTLYSDLVKNAQKINQTGGDASQDLNLATTLVSRQADMLSGFIGVNKDEVLRLEKKLRVVRNESESGRKLLADIGSKNLRIQDDAKRLKAMAELLASMEVDASYYEKTVVQSIGSISTDVFDKKVAAQLFTEWWLKTKKWFTKEAPAIIGKTITFLSIMLLAYIIAFLVKKMLHRVFKQTRPDMSELAQKFIVSMSAKIIIIIGFLLALSNLGIQIGPLLAGLGIMGFIIGFALQDTLSNFASGLMILIYRPYDVGDKIRVAGIEGKVSKMNLVNSTIYTSENHELTIPNNKIWEDIIHNITSVALHRLDLYFEAPFTADSETVLAAISKAIDESPLVIDDKDKEVRIYQLGKREVKYLARFWISTEDIDEAKWAIPEGVKKRFDEDGISLKIIESAQTITANS